MELIDQVCSLEHAKKLKELSIRQGSFFSWFDTEAFGLILERSDHAFDLDHYLSVARIASAFTVAELGEMLPKELIIEDIDYYLTQAPSRDLKRHIVFYRNAISSVRDCESDDENEANARAKLLIHLIENNLILGSSYK